MTAENFDKALVAMRDARPFRLFTVELVGGQRIEVDHPNTFVVRDGVAIFVAPGGYPVIFDHDSVLRFIGATSTTDV